MSFNFSDLGKLIAQSAPLLGGALAGPAGATIGNLIAAKFGGDNAHPDTLHALINADPQAAIKLKELELEHQLALQQLLVQAEKDAQQLAVHDRASARQREADVSNASKENHDPTPARLAYALTFGVLGSLFWLLVFPIPDKNHEIIYAIVSCLTTVWIGAMAYYHGSSAGSRLKDDRLTSHWMQQQAGHS